MINAVLENSFSNAPEPKEIQAKTALEIEESMKNSIYEKDTLIIDWQTNSEIEKELKNNLDDLLFEKQQQYDTQFSFDKIDELIEEVIKIAKLKFV